MSPHRLKLLMVATHLTIVICGASYLLPYVDVGVATPFVRWYGTMSGAGTRYGFFAPTVGARHRARFLLRDDNGRSWWDTFDESASPEARLRLTGIVEAPFTSGETYDFPQWRRRLITAWAATMFSRHPTTSSLTVVVEFLDVPAIADYRTGAPPKWETVYRAEFERESVTCNGGGTP